MARHEAGSHRFIGRWMGMEAGKIVRADGRQETGDVRQEPENEMRAASPPTDPHLNGSFLPACGFRLLVPYFSSPVSRLPSQNVMPNVVIVRFNGSCRLISTNAPSRLDRKSVV